MAMKRFALCLSNDFGDVFSDADVLPGVAYQTLGEERGSLRIVDESGDDFLYPAKHFLLLNDAQSAQLAQGLLLGSVRGCCTPNDRWLDPIVEELHEIRTQLLEKHGGDLHALSEAARARALALGFQFTTIRAPERKDATVLPKKTSATG
mgnify:CR=1 FL=1